MNRLRSLFTTTLVAVALVGLGTGCSNDFGQVSSHESVALGKDNCDSRTTNNLKKLLDCVTVDGVRAHQAAFQAIADANGGTRAAGTPGYDASVDYVAQALEASGYQVEINAFPFTFVPPAALSQLTPINVTYETGRFAGTGFGTVTAPVVGVDLALGNADWPADPSTSTSGCEASDFGGFPVGSIALIQRGACFFSVKAANAEAAGAVAVVIFNQGDSPTRLGLIVGNATAFPDGSPSNLTKPLVGASYANGVALSQAGSTAFVNVDPPQQVTSYNVLAETSEGDPDNVVMVGGHLDGVLAGPGIQDNGSGSAAILETAIQMGDVKPRNKIRFAWWGAQESGGVGSTAYVNGLSQEELDKIALYLDFHMIGSPNHVFFVKDGDGSDFFPGPEGSAQIEALFESYYDGMGLPYKATPFEGGNDYVPFFVADIPVGGLFTGSFGVKTVEEAAIWGGTAGDQYDPCYHLACDTFDNVSLYALDVNSDAVAYATLSFGMSTEVINWQKSKGNFKPDEEADAPGALAAF